MFSYSNKFTDNSTIVGCTLCSFGCSFFFFPTVWATLLFQFYFIFNFLNKKHLSHSIPPGNYHITHLSWSAWKDTMQERRRHRNTSSGMGHKGYRVKTKRSKGMLLSETFSCWQAFTYNSTTDIMAANSALPCKEVLWYSVRCWG